jgi:hypothetical protein
VPNTNYIFSLEAENYLGTSGNTLFSLETDDPATSIRI